MRSRTRAGLNDAALVAYGRREDVERRGPPAAQAFAANPLDSEVVGNLAFLHLKERPPQAEAARQLALHALTLNDPRFPSGRIEDWTTLAVASALDRHDADARNAWFASMALASDLQQQCDTAVRAEAIYGERLASFGAGDAAAGALVGGVRPLRASPKRRTSPRAPKATPASRSKRAQRATRLVKHLRHPVKWRPPRTGVAP